MFGRGTQQLLEALPHLSNLDESILRRLITAAWLDAADRRDLGGEGLDGAADVTVLRRLATALEVHALVARDLTRATINACAFVAAEALEIARELEAAKGAAEGGSHEESLEAGVLYLIAGYDSNAATSVRDLAIPEDLPPSERHARKTVAAFLRLVVPPTAPSSPEPAAEDTSLRDRVRDALWRRLAAILEEYLTWLREPAAEDPRAGDALRVLAAELTDRGGGRPSARHLDIHHLAILLALAVDSTSERALRQVPPPETDGQRFAAFRARRCEDRPLLWPAAAEYVRLALPGPGVHAVIAVPTGAGKGSIAELAIAQALETGWVLYLAPTNALVGQVRRQLNEVVGRLDGVLVREFLGGAEYTLAPGENLEAIGERHVLVMTPEKCSLALRQNPAAFAKLSLCVVDEAHQLGQRDRRAVIAELVVSEVLFRAPSVRMLLMSALVQNPESLAEWLSSATNVDAPVISEPWRPTRTLRAVAGIDLSRLAEEYSLKEEQLRMLPPRRTRLGFKAPLALLAGLQGPWNSGDPEDYVLVPTESTVALSLVRDRQTGKITVDPSGWVRPAIESLAQNLGRRGHRVIAFLPRSRHDSFAAAGDIPGFGATNLAPTVVAYLLLADAELGITSVVRGALEKGVAVHTSAMLTEERRASEIAFDSGEVRVLFATGTLSQGLNLPATVVLIGGTSIGYSSDATEAQIAERRRLQLLNAIGRAGRATVASRSMAIVVPTKVLTMDPSTIVTKVLPRADFLAEEDASTAIQSELDGIVRNALGGTLDLGTMSSTEQTAFAYLSFAEDHDSAVGVVRSSWAAQRAGATASAAQIAEAIRLLGQRFLDESGSPAYLAAAAHRAGVSLPVATAMHDALVNRLQRGLPEALADWADVLVDVLGELPVHILRGVVRSEAFSSTVVDGAWSSDLAARRGAWKAFRGILEAWLAGASIADIAAAAHAVGTRIGNGRGARDPLPRTLRLIHDGLEFDLAVAAGAIVALLEAQLAEEPDSGVALAPAALVELGRLPLAIRFGLGDRKALALYRAGARPRAVARILADHVAAPDEGDAEQLDIWANAIVRSLPAILDVLRLSDGERKAIEAIQVVRVAR